MKVEILAFKFDPRTKVIFFTALFSLAFICKDIWTLLVIILVVVFIALKSRERDRVLKGLKVMVPVLIVAFILWTFLHEWSLFYTYEEGAGSFNIGVFMTIRLLLIIITSLTFISVVTPGEMIKALESFKLPYKLVFVLGLTLRHVSTISDEYLAIKEAQTTRGLELDKGFLVKRIKNYNPVLIPLLIRSMESAEKLVLAMELKSFSFKKRSRYLRIKMSSIDYISITLVLVIVIIAVLHYVIGVM